MHQMQLNWKNVFLDCEHGRLLHDADSLDLLHIQLEELRTAKKMAAMSQSFKVCVSQKSPYF